MVMTGDQAKSVIFGDEGLVHDMKRGSVVILTATIKPAEAKEIGARLAPTGLAFIDSPVSGGFSGAQNGTLTMMAAAKPDANRIRMPDSSSVGGTLIAKHLERVVN